MIVPTPGRRPCPVERRPAPPRRPTTTTGSACPPPARPPESPAGGAAGRRACAPARRPRPGQCRYPRSGSQATSSCSAWSRRPRPPRSKGCRRRLNGGPKPKSFPPRWPDEIRSLRKIVEQHLAGFAWGEGGRSAPAKTDVLRQLLDAGFSPQFARDLLCDPPPEMDASQAMVAWVKGPPTAASTPSARNGTSSTAAAFHALVGPTGVGKTTTTAAGRPLRPKHGPNKVALVTTDGYRIGVPTSSCASHGRILGVSVHSEGCRRTAANPG